MDSGQKLIKLADASTACFITLYNELEGHCGIIVMATSMPEKTHSPVLQYEGYRGNLQPMAVFLHWTRTLSYTRCKRAFVCNSWQRKTLMNGFKKGTVIAMFEECELVFHQ
jgi:hypothetical protein